MLTLPSGGVAPALMPLMGLLAAFVVCRRLASLPQRKLHSSCRSDGSSFDLTVEEGYNREG